MCSRNLVGHVAHELSKLFSASSSVNSNSGEDRDI